MNREKWLKEFKVYFEGKRTLKYETFVEFIEFLLAMQKKELNAKAMIGTRKLLETVVKKERERIIKELKLAKNFKDLNNKIDNLK